MIDEETTKYNPLYLKTHLLKDILPFWKKHCLDTEYGGYLPHLSRDGSLYPSNEEKHLVATTRLIYNFAQGHIISPEEKYLEQALWGFEFLKEYFWDKTDDGWFWILDRKGNPMNPQKNCYGHDFALLATSELYRASGDKEVLEYADKSYEIIEKKFKDTKAGGYWDIYDKSWTTVDKKRTQNSQMHLVEAFLSFYKATSEKTFLKRACELSDFMYDKLYDKVNGCLGEFFDSDWTFDLKNDQISPGHHVEWAWLLSLLHEFTNEDKYLEIAKKMLKFALLYGYDDKYAGFYDQVDRNGKLISSNKSWWPQCEGLCAFVWLKDKVSEFDLSMFYKKTAEFIFNYFADREYGSWFGILRREGVPKDTRKGWSWKTDYHIVKMCSETYQREENLNI